MNQLMDFHITLFFKTFSAYKTFERIFQIRLRFVEAFQEPVKVEISEKLCPHRPTLHLKRYFLSRSVLWTFICRFKFLKSFQHLLELRELLSYTTWCFNRSFGYVNFLTHVWKNLHKLTSWREEARKNDIFLYFFSYCSTKSQNRLSS
jgi:hypothetical protein